MLAQDHLALGKNAHGTSGATCSYKWSTVFLTDRDSNRAQSTLTEQPIIITCSICVYISSSVKKKGKSKFYRKSELSIWPCSVDIVWHLVLLVL